MTDGSSIPKVLAATETPGESGMKWFQGTADAVRHFLWLFEVGEHLIASRTFLGWISSSLEHLLFWEFDHYIPRPITVSDVVDSKFYLLTQDVKHKQIENILILSGDHFYRMDYIDFLQVKSEFRT